jgi:hypothetical protein
MELGPTFVLTINLVLQVDQRIHSVGKRNNFRVAIDLDPAAPVKGLCKDAKGSARVAPQVVDLVSGLSMLMMTRPSASSPGVIGDIWRLPFFRRVASTPQ